MASAIGTGSGITFSGWSGAVTNITRNSVSRPAVRSSYLGSTTWDTFLPGKISNPGQVVMDVHFDPSKVTQYETLISNTTPTTLYLTIGTENTATTNAQVTASAFVVDVEQALPLEDMMTGSITFQMTSTPTSRDQQ